jgi:MFS family permease
MSEARAAAVPPAVAWYAVGILTLAYILSYIDRSILALLVGPIRADFAISDTQFSLLHGLAFAIFYTIMGIPIGRWADRTNRRKIIAIGVAAWSLMTALCGLTRNFWQLFLARVGVGVGEAALSPAAYSMIADLFSRERLGRAMGIYASGVFVGIGMSFLIGGLVVDWIAARGFAADSGYSPWQIVFFIVGLPGLIVALLVLTIREPPRRGLPAGLAGGRGIPVRDVLAYMRTHTATYVGHFLGFATLTLVFNAIMSWAPEYFIRTFGMARSEVGFWLGLIVLCFGGTGIIAGGLTSDWLTRRGYTDGPLRAGLIGAACLAPFAVTATVVSSAQLSLLLFCPLLFFASFPFSPAAAALQIVTPNPMRAQISAVYLFVVNLTGIGLGGTVTALVTDFVFRDDQMLRYSMSWVGGIGALIACAVLWWAAGAFRRSMAAQHIQ